MKRFNQSESIEKRARIVAEREEKANMIVDTFVRRALKIQRKKYMYIIAACILISFLLGFLTRYIPF